MKTITETAARALAIAYAEMRVCRRKASEDWSPDNLRAYRSAVNELLEVQIETGLEVEHPSDLECSLNWCRRMLTKTHD